MPSNFLKLLNNVTHQLVCFREYQLPFQYLSGSIQSLSSSNEQAAPERW